MNQECQAWQRTVRANHRERSLPPPALPSPRSLQIHPDQIPVSPPRRKWLLRVESDFFTAGAIWEKIGGVWSCTSAAPILKWMIGQSPESVGASLLKMGAKHQFLRLKDPNVMGLSHGVNA